MTIFRGHSIQRSTLGGTTFTFADGEDLALANVFKIIVDDDLAYTAFTAKHGDLRFYDPDGAADYVQFTTDPATGKIFLVSSAITDNNLFEIDHNGTISGATATATINEIDLDLAGIEIADAATNAITLRGMYADWSGITLTTVGLSTIYGQHWIFPDLSGFANAAGINLDMFAATDIALTTDGTIVAVALSAETLDLTPTSNVDALDIILTNDGWTGAVAIDIDIGDFVGGANIIDIVFTEAGTITSDTTIINIDANSLITVNTGTVDLQGIDIDFSTVVDTDFNTFYGINIDMPTVYQGTDPTAAIRTTGNGMVVEIIVEGDNAVLISGESNATSNWFEIKPSVQTINTTSTINYMLIDTDNITVNDGATSPVIRGLYMNLDDMTETDVNLTTLKGIRIDMPDQSAYADSSAIYVSDANNRYVEILSEGTQLVDISAVVTDGDNGYIPLSTNRCITGDLTVDRDLTGFSISHSIVNNNLSTGDFDLDFATGLMSLTMQHQSVTTVGAKTDPDVFSATCLDFDIDAVTNDVNTKQDASPRAIDIAYSIINTAGTLRLGTTDIFRIYPQFLGTITSAGAFTFNVIKEELQSITLDDVNITFNAIELDALDLTNTNSTAARLINLVCPSNSNIDQAIRIIADTTTANTTQNIKTSRDISGTIAGAVGFTNYANVFGQECAHSGGDFILTNDEGIMELVLSHNLTIDTAANDVFSATALKLDIDAICNHATGELTATPRGIDIDFAVTETSGTLELGTTDVLRVNFTDLAFSTAAAMNLYGINAIVANAETFNDANITFKLINVDASNITNTASTLVAGMDITMGASADMGLRVTMGATPATGGIQVVCAAATDTAFTTNGEIVAGNLPSYAYLPYEDFVTRTLTNCTVTKVLDANEDEIALDIDNTGGGAGLAEIHFQYRIPSDWKAFAGGSDDIVIRAIQDAGADIDATITIDFLDNAGTDSDDDSVAAAVLTNAWAIYDCAINTDGTFVAGDAVDVFISIVLTDTDDHVRIIFPKVKYNRIS